MDIAKRVNVIQAEMDWKVDENEAHSLFLLAALGNLALHLEAVGKEGLSPDGVKIVSETISMIAGELYKQLVKHSNRGTAVMTSALKVAHEQFLKDLATAQYEANGGHR